MFDERKNNNRLNRFNGNQSNGLFNDPYDNLIYGILQQFNLETLKKPNTENGIDMELEKDITAEDFIDELFISLRTIYNATISIDNLSTIEVKFSDKCRFNIQIKECKQ